MRSIPRLSNWSTLESHHSSWAPDARCDAWAEVSSHAPRSVWACSPLTPASAASNRATPSATAAAVTRRRVIASRPLPTVRREPKTYQRMARSVETTLPSRTITSRSANAATLGSCVTRITVEPSSRAVRVKRPITSSPVSESREPVGSSAKSTSGCATSPRASATRWAWPPDISPVRWRSRPSRNKS